jgi:hypothetical protein
MAYCMQAAQGNLGAAPTDEALDTIMSCLHWHVGVTPPHRRIQIAPLQKL